MSEFDFNEYSEVDSFKTFIEDIDELNNVAKNLVNIKLTNLKVESCGYTNLNLTQDGGYVQLYTKSTPESIQYSSIKVNTNDYELSSEELELINEEIKNFLEEIVIIEFINLSLELRIYFGAEDGSW